MNWSGIKTTARKELRGYFLSPIALIFLGVFLVATLFIFFTISKFFARNLADVRPLFSWMPVMLIFLVGALTMRQWSEEQKMGTLEILMTLPIRTADLVVGKFLAGLALVGVALLLTTPIAITVAMLGQLDWGPVIGGYVAAMLLASTYLAIGLCVSARTDNQIVALMVTVVLCLVLYALGHDLVAGFFGHQVGEVLRAIGTGSRFASIERGVLDVRDLAYYGSLTAFFLLLNVYFLEAKRIDEPDTKASWKPAGMLSVSLVAMAGVSQLLSWDSSIAPVLLAVAVLIPLGRWLAISKGTVRYAAAITVVLAGVNVLAANLWLAPVTKARADLTADGEYSISEVTERMLADLDEPLTVNGYFSEKTHPLLAPLVPRIRDFLHEYEVRGHGKVTVNFIDPNKDETIEEEINEQFGIKSLPFQVSGRHEQAVVNSYFHILVKYGDEYEVLNFQDIIEVHGDDTEVNVRLRNLEYDVTRAIKKATQGFQSIEAVLARSEKPVKLTAYVSAKLPEEFKEVPERLAKVTKELSDRGAGQFAFETVDPSGDKAMAQELYQKYGIRPQALDLFGQSSFYLHFLIEAGDRKEVVYPQGAMSEADLKTTIEASIKRATPGFLKTVGILTQEKGGQPNPMQQMQGMPPPKQMDYRMLERQMGEELQIKRVQLKDGRVPGEVDALIVGKPGELDEKQLFAIDQYLMRGGAVIALAGAYDVEISRQAMTAKKTNAEFLSLLETYGVKVGESLVMDPNNTRFPVPVNEKRGPFTFKRIKLIPYPFFADIRQDGFNKGHAALAGVPSVALTWSSPVKLMEGVSEGLTKDVLLETSEGSWLRTNTELTPSADGSFEKDEGATTGRQPVGVTLVGSFKSHFADKASPLFGEDAKPEGDLKEKADRTGRTIKKSTPNARLAVVGSSEFVSDIISQLGQQMGGGGYRGNFVLIRNLVDWALEDTDLLTIRSAGAFARTLKSMEEKERAGYELVNYAVVLLALFGVMFIATTRRKMAKPIQLTKEA